MARVWFLVVLAGCASESAAPVGPEAPPQTAVAPPEAPPAVAADVTRKTTRAGLYVLDIRSTVLPVPLRALHEWVLAISTPDGRPVSATRVDVDGGMPDHGHGFPTRPRAERVLAPGELLVEGVKFNMQGKWQLSFRVLGPAGVDDATFTLQLTDAGGRGAVKGDAYVELVASLSIDALGPMPGDPSNRVSRDPGAVALGRALFFDPGLSRTGRIACASCHEPERFFTDGLAKAMGLEQSGRNAPTLVGSGYGKWFTWDGRRDSMWAQAVTPIESLGEMGSTRLEAVRYVLSHAEHGPAYEALFGAAPAALRDAGLPGRAGPFADAAAKAAWAALKPETQTAISAAYANIGKTMDAFQRELSPTPSRFDRYARALVGGGAAAADKILTADERAGLRLFVDDSRTQCLRCHNGPLFTNFGFHNADTGSVTPPNYDLGRSIGVQAARVDPFNCLGPFSDAPPTGCKELRFADTVHTGGRKRGAFKVPTLRNVGATGPYMHDGRFTTLLQVLAHYREPTPPETSRHELARTRLTDAEAGQIIAFLNTLTSDERPQVP